MTLRSFNNNPRHCLDSTQLHDHQSKKRVDEEYRRYSHQSINDSWSSSASSYKPYIDQPCIQIRRLMISQLMQQREPRLLLTIPPGSTRSGDAEQRYRLLQPNEWENRDKSGKRIKMNRAATIHGVKNDSRLLIKVWNNWKLSPNHHKDCLQWHRTTRPRPARDHDDFNLLSS